MTSRSTDLHENVDPISRLIYQANDLLAASPVQADVDRFVAALTELHPRELVRFDWQSRSWNAGINQQSAAGLRGPLLRGARKLLWQTLALVSGDGYERERAIKAAAPTVLTARLVVLRCLDWVEPVRRAALARLDFIPDELLAEALPLAEQLAAERHRGHILDSLLDARLSDNHLRFACRAADVRVRRAAWQRLVARDAATPMELRDTAARDSDPIVRSVASTRLDTLAGEDQRSLAEALVNDPVGWVAAPALAILVDLDGAPAIERALTARTSAVRGAARDWAAIHGVDARSIYLRRLADRADDAIALAGLAEVGDSQDAGVFYEMLSDQRSRIAAAGIRALSRVDNTAGRAAAIDALRAGRSGRIMWAAADVLRGTTPSVDEAAVLTSVTRDPERPISHRFRALALLRPSRWLHLAVLLETRAESMSPRVRRRLDTELAAWIGFSGRINHLPAAALRARIDALIPTVSEECQRRIQFILSTSAR